VVSIHIPLGALHLCLLLHFQWLHSGNRACTDILAASLALNEWAMKAFVWVAYSQCFIQSCNPGGRGVWGGADEPLPSMGSGASVFSGGAKMFARGANA
jgi:hypothetical protein